MAAEIGYTLKDSATLEYSKHLTAEKTMFVCGQVSGQPCSTVDDNAIFNYIATRASAAIRYLTLISGKAPEGSSNHLMNPSWFSNGKTIAAYARNFQGSGSLADWGNESMFRNQSTKDSIYGAGKGEASDQYLAKYTSGDTLYFLNNDQNYYWYDLDNTE